MGKAKLTCREFVEFLDDYVADEQSGDVRATFEKHIAKCPPCADYVRTYQETIELGKCVCRDGEGAPGDVPEQLIDAILQARRSQ